ncbi:protein of unknown function DUF540 [Gloeothece citriformis PCC 7424]|uniref:Sulfate transport protein CysZ n=1 Tax=Gloeothece citriformis (strain PCC 7424) TaxID=65393 RepID=B7KG55_GLOC7|nr:EI24 domain-containing protein [Gloeothece citriformis]ACK70526.1 protein of unknown function DUF540 [Gloeothece citriformis PCC 7424]
MLQILSGFGLLTGASYPFRALRVIKNTPQLWGYLVTPIIVNIFLGITLYAGLVYLGWQLVEDWTIKLSQWVDTLIVNLPTWLSILEGLITGVEYFLDLVLVIILLIIIGFIFAQFGTLLGAPWYGQLSEQLEKIRTGKIETVEVGIIRDIWRAILFEIKKLFLIVIVGIPLFLFNFVPGIGTLTATVGGISLTGTIVCLDFFDAPLERRRLHFRKKLQIVLTSLPASAGFGAVCLGLISVPLLNLITIPLCVASGTLFFCDRILPKLKS